jgi:hypothetical protein
MVNLKLSYKDAKGHLVHPVSYRKDKKLIRIPWFWCEKCQRFIASPENEKSVVIE